MALETSLLQDLQGHTVFITVHYRPDMPVLRRQLRGILTVEERHICIFHHDRQCRVSVTNPFVGAIDVADLTDEHGLQFTLTR